MTKWVILTGAGISAESGIKTFRDDGGLWEGHRVEDVATPEAWYRQPQVVLDFYNQRRRQLHTVQPNAAHHALAALEQHAEVTIITQNVDDLHERAGSTRILHLHGELRKSRGDRYPHHIYECAGDIHIGDLCQNGSQLRPHIVWFGESVPMIEPSIEELSTATHVMVIGSSMQVYPAASLIQFAPDDAAIYYVDPKPSVNYELSLRKQLIILPLPASVGVPQVIREWLEKNQ